MKCPKCGYLGFEDSDRCRNCGYEFSLAPVSPAVPDVLIHPEPSVPGPNLELWLGRTDPAAGSPPPVLDASFNPDTLANPLPADAFELPLFGDRPGEDAPLIKVPPRPRAPLAVRRATPEVPRARTRAARPRTGELDLGALPVGAPGPAGSAAVEPGDPAATPSSRLMATIVDLSVVVGVDIGVVYLTLRVCGLDAGEWGRLPIVPLTAFLLLLNGGYIVAFTAVGGQSIGQMAFGIKVVGQERQPVSFGRATLRALVCLGSALVLGLGFLPALVGRDRRTLHDRIAGTRVIRASSP